MKSYFAIYQSSPSAAPVNATVLVFEKNLSIGFRNEKGGNEMVNWLLKDVHSTFEFSTQQTKLVHHKIANAELRIEGGEAARTITDMQTEQQKPWHKKKSGRDWVRNSLLAVGVLGALFLLYLLIVPWLSQQLAGKISVSTEKQLGDAVYDAMDLTAQEDHAKGLILDDFFSEMKVATAYDIRITVVKSSVVNAFSLPGGHIVVYTALLDKIDSYPELAALLSHEFVHVNNKHSTKSIFRRLGSKIFLGLLFGKFGSVSNVLVNHADNLKSLKYSRRLEKEADLDGLNILKQRGIDPAGFVNLFNHLKEAAPADSQPEFLGSHPDVDKRIHYIDAAAKGTDVKEDVRLKAIFEQLKNK